MVGYRLRCAEKRELIHGEIAGRAPVSWLHRGCSDTRHTATFTPGCGPTRAQRTLTSSRTTGAPHGEIAVLAAHLERVTATAVLSSVPDGGGSRCNHAYNCSRAHPTGIQHFPPPTVKITIEVLDIAKPVTPRQRLGVLREQLDGMAPYPWSNIETWAAGAKSLIRQQYSAHLSDFETLIKAPNPTAAAYIVSGGRHGPRRDNFAGADARIREGDQAKAQVAKRRLLAWLDGLIAESEHESQVEGALERLTILLDRFPLAVRALSHRYGQRPPLEIADEYDLQYILEPILIGCFRDVRPEEWTPSYAGGASRMDFLLKPDRLVVETKVARASHSARSLADELIVDKERYEKHPDCGALVCFVYDPHQRLRQPEALEHDLRQDGAFPVLVIVRPK